MTVSCDSFGNVPKKHDANAHARKKCFSYSSKSNPGGLVIRAGQIPIFLNTAPQNLKMVDLIGVDDKKINLEVSNQILYGLKA